MSNTELFIEAMKAIWWMFWSTDIIGKMIILGTAFLGFCILRIPFIKYEGNMRWMPWGGRY